MAKIDETEASLVKARGMLRAARTEFLEAGFEGTSVDAIARRAGVSKPTLYAYFGDKRAVFEAVIRQECEEHARQIFKIGVKTGDLRTSLVEIATRLIQLVISPGAQSVFRTAVAESKRFPALGRAFYEAGPGLGYRLLGEHLKSGVAHGELLIDDVEQAAQQFVCLCRGDIFFRNLLCDERPSSKQVARTADNVVTMFLKAYSA